MANIFTKVGDLLNASLDARINDLQKSQQAEPAGEALAKAMKEDGFGRKGLIFDPFTEQSNSGSLFKPKTWTISPTILKQVSRRDPVVVAILDVRANQVAAACNKQANRFDVGFKFFPKNANVQPDPDKITKAEEFILNTGYVEGRSAEDKMSFADWGYAIARDLLVYGHAAVEKVPRSDNTGLGAFLPLAAESIYYANKGHSQEEIQHMRDSWRAGIEHDSVISTPKMDGDVEYVQVVEGKVTETYTRKEMVFIRYNTETDLDLNGYSLGPLEKSLTTITDHLKIENHQRAFFTHGVASRGLLVIQGDVTPNQLRTLQSQWTQQTTGTLAAWRTPVLAGVQQVQWVPLSASNRDMEFAAYQDHILRTIFSVFAMDPEEAGFGYLSKGTEQRSLGESSNEWKITASRDRGLRPVLARIEAVINEEILPSYDEQFSKDYHFKFVGLDAETEAEETQRLQAETTLHTTLDEARAQAEKDKYIAGGNLIMNQLLIQTLRTSMPFGMWMEKFIGIPGAASRPDLQFIDNPSWFQWQQVQLQLAQMQAAAQGAAQGGDPNDPNGGDDGEEEGEEKDGGGSDAGPPGSPGNKKGPPKGGKGDGQDDGEGSEEDQEALIEAQRQQAIQQGQAVDLFIQSNPELFKAYKAAQDLAKSQAAPLKKSTKAPKPINDKHVDKARDELTKEFRKASTWLVKEIMEAVKDETNEERDPKED